MNVFDDRGLEIFGSRARPSGCSELPFRPVANAKAQPFLAGPERVSVRWNWREDDRAVVGEIYFGTSTEGPPGHVHGGAIASILDEAMSLACFLSKRMVLAARLEVDLRAPLKLETFTIVTSQLTQVDGRKCFTAATLGSGDTLHAESKGLFISPTAR